MPNGPEPPAAPPLPREGPDRDPVQYAAIFKRFVDEVAAAAAAASPLFDRVAAHLGADPTHLPVIAEEFDAFEQPNVQVALDAVAAAPGRRAEVVGVAGENKRFMSLTLSDALTRTGSGFGRPHFAEGPVDYVNYRLADERVLSCVQFGLYLIATEAGWVAGASDGDRARLVVLVTGPTEGGPRQRLRVEAMATRREDAQGFFAELLAAMTRLNVYRGHVISLAPGQFGMGPQTLVQFHRLPSVAREDVVLPAGLLERVERHTVGFAAHAPELLAAGRSLKRGLLLYGPPGVGKTLTLMYLSGRMRERTVLLTTGAGMGLLHHVAQLARALSPAMVVLEDVDLIAEERQRPFAGGPLLFELLNEMDGLGDDQDVIFVLTTNRPDILEPALAARPGRIDLAVELPLPDAAGRRRLLELYARGLHLEGVDLDAVATRTEGVSPAYVKELLRKAALLAAEAQGETGVARAAPAAAAATDGQGGGIVVRPAHLTEAMEELSQGGRLAERLLGFRPLEAPGAPGGAGAAAAPTPTGFPTPAAWQEAVGESVGG